VARNWPYIKQCLQELQELLNEASKVDMRNTPDVYYYEVMVQVAMEELEYELKL
jgi:hypothetical protein